MICAPQCKISAYKRGAKATDCSVASCINEADSRGRLSLQTGRRKELCMRNSVAPYKATAKSGAILIVGGVFVRHRANRGRAKRMPTLSARGAPSAPARKIGEFKRGQKTCAAVCLSPLLRKASAFKGTPTPTQKYFRPFD